MTRITLVAFVLLTGFFYMTGKPVDENDPAENRFALLSGQGSGIEAVSRTQSAKITAGRIEVAAQGKEGKASQAVIVAPVRNPRRSKALLTPRLASRQGLPASADTARSSTTFFAQPKSLVENRTKTLAFNQAGADITRVAARPMIVSYRQRYAKTRKPVLGPRLTAVLLKRELRRVGCYSGNVTGSWDKAARDAMQNFNKSAGASLVVDNPAIASLERLQQVSAIVCSKKPSVGRTVIASVPAVSAKAEMTRKSGQWRTKVRARKAALRPLPTSVRSRTGQARMAVAPRKYSPAAVRRAKKRTVGKRYQARNIKRIKIAKRKARRKTAIRSWKRTYRRKKFGFSSNGGSFSLNN